MRLAIDVMGGELAPKAPIEGALNAIKQFPDLEITFVGDEREIKKYLPNNIGRISILHTEEKIEDTDSPTIAVRRKKNSSMVLAIKEVKEGRSDACVSAGNTGALMTAGLLFIGRIPGIDRPALTPTLPTLDGKGFIIIDAGANMDAKPDHLLQYAIMGNIYMKNVKKIERPRIGLLNVGTEEGKGNELTKEAFTLLKNADINFIGNVESRDLLFGIVDVLVCDGFGGNIVLKTTEGTAKALSNVLKKEFTKSLKNKFATLLLKPSLKSLKTMMDYSEYGGALLFGLKAPVIKSHGSSTARAFYTTIVQAKEIVEKKVIQTIEEQVSKLNV